MQHRIPTYLSPSAIALFTNNPKDYYLSYLSPVKPPRAEQTLAMAAGSAFDAYVKSYLYNSLFGKGNDPKFDLAALFEAQVDSIHRDYCWTHGQYVFDHYKSSGCLADLMLELTSAIGKPRFELEITGVVDGYREGVTKDIKGVILLGKPDLFYTNKLGCNVIIDWKLNGYVSSYRTSPTAGYVKIRDSNSRHHNSFHKDCVPMMHKGVLINIATYLENLNSQWADQLSIYSWLLGANVGEDF